MIITEEQESLLNILSKYSQFFYSFVDCKNCTNWLKEEIKLETALGAVRDGSYINGPETLEEYINDCIVCIEEVETINGDIK